MGTSGSLFIGTSFCCYTIKLPWRENKPCLSCIPEGVYPLTRRYSRRWGWHLAVMDVPGRDFILVHPANHALTELEGCIAPVSRLTGPGSGINSRAAFFKLLSAVSPALEKVSLTLTITRAAAIRQLRPPLQKTA
jgi:hypothetical protein